MDPRPSAAADHAADPWIGSPAFSWLGGLARSADRRPPADVNHVDGCSGNRSCLHPQHEHHGDDLRPGRILPISTRTEPDALQADHYHGLPIPCTTCYLELLGEHLVPVIVYNIRFQNVPAAAAPTPDAHGTTGIPTRTEETASKIYAYRRSGEKD